MSKKVKEFSKKYLIGLTLSFLVSLTGVLAVTSFPSENTIYDNSATGMSATNVQNAVDELYNVCFPPTPAGDTILEDVPVVSSGAGLYAADEEGRYFYKGKNVNNYVTFNNETWRIISIEPDKTIKIMRWKSIGNRAWDSLGGPGNNNWARPADLNTYLNGTYVSRLNSTAQSQIVAKDWSIGAVTFTDTSLPNSTADENSKKWNGKVALPTASEYIRSNSNQSSCGNMNQIWNSTTCDNTTWMHNNDYWWTLSPYAGRSYAVFYVRSDGGVFGDNAAISHGVRPAVYISNEVQIVSGNGSSENPYQIM